MRRPSISISRRMPCIRPSGYRNSAAASFFVWRNAAFHTLLRRRTPRRLNRDVPVCYNAPSRGIREEKAMPILRVPLFLSVLILAAACSAPARGPASPAGSGDAAEAPDRIRLMTGETVEGRIVEDGSRQVL